MKRHRTTASGASSYYEGKNSKASGSMSYAEGSHTRASGHLVHSEGYGATAMKEYKEFEPNVTYRWM